MRKQRLKEVTKLSQNHRDRKLQNRSSEPCILVPRPIGWGSRRGRGRNTAPVESHVGSLEPAELQNRTQEAQVYDWRVSYTQEKDRSPGLNLAAWLSCVGFAGSERSIFTYCRGRFIIELKE